MYEKRVDGQLLQHKEYAQGSRTVRAPKEPACRDVPREGEWTIASTQGVRTGVQDCKGAKGACLQGCMNKGWIDHRFNIR